MLANSATHLVLARHYAFSSLRCVVIGGFAGLFWLFCPSIGVYDRDVQVMRL